MALRLLSPSSSWEFDSDTLLYRYETDPSNYSRDEWTVDEVMDLYLERLLNILKMNTATIFTFHIGTKQM